MAFFAFLWRVGNILFHFNCYFVRYNKVCECGLMCRYLREEGKALVTQATDEQSQQTNAVTYIQVTTEIPAYIHCANI